MLGTLKGHVTWCGLNHGRVFEEMWESMVEWLLRMFNECFHEGGVLKEWNSACIVPLYKGNGEGSDWAN